jgi:hypothetical protein
MRLLVFLLSLLATVNSQLSQVKMSHEEQVVRTTYARLSYAIQVGEIARILHDTKVARKPIDRGEFSQRLKDAALRFELTDFKVGTLSEISQTKYSALVTKPDGGPALAIGAGIWQMATDDPKETKSDVASAKWTKAQTLTEDWEVPFGEAYPKTQIAGQHNRFAAFTVKASFQGRSIEYRALFLFGKDAQGQESILPIDTVSNLNGSALNVFLNHSAYPETLIEGGIGKDPVIYDWLSAGQVSQPTSKRREANCDPVTMNCGVHSDDLKTLKPPPRSLVIPFQTRQPHLVAASFHAATAARPHACRLSRFCGQPNPYLL